MIKGQHMMVCVEWAYCNNTSSRVAPQDYCIFILSQQIKCLGQDFFVILSQHNYIVSTKYEVSVRWNYFIRRYFVLAGTWVVYLTTLCTVA